MMHICGVLGDPKNASKILPCRGDLLLERVRVLERSRDGVREGPGEKRRSDDARASGVGGTGATPYRAKALGRAPPWTTAALPDFRPSGRGRQRRRQALGTCGLSRRKFGAQKDPAMLMMPAAYPIRTL